MPLFLVLSDIRDLVMETNLPGDLSVFFHIVPGFFWRTLTRSPNGMGGCSVHAVESGIFKCQALSEQLISTVL